MGSGSTDAKDPGGDAFEAMMFRDYVRTRLGPATAKSLFEQLDRFLADGYRGITVADDLDMCTFSADEANVTFDHFGFHTLSVEHALVIVEAELDDHHS